MTAAVRFAFLWPAFYACAAASQLQLLPPVQPPQVFAGPARRIELTWRNPGGQTLDIALRHRLYQASSATAAPFSEAPWKRLVILPGQTVIESAELDFPPVRAETRFIVQWLEGSNTVAGVSDVLVYPTNLLEELGVIAGEQPVGVVDPDNVVKPLLQSLGIEFADLEAAEVGEYPGKLIIAGPFRNRGQMRNGLAVQLAAAARKGAAVIWIQPPRARQEQLRQSFYTVVEGAGAVVVAEADLVSGLAGAPQAQLHLVQLARRALRPEPPRLTFELPQ